MNRREFLLTSSLAGLASLGRDSLSLGTLVSSNSSGDEQPAALSLLPFPQQLTVTPGSIAIGKPKFRFTQEKTSSLQIAMKSLLECAGEHSEQLMVNLGSLEEGYERAWLSVPDNQWLAADGTSSEAGAISITKQGVTVVGKGRAGMLYGAQTINQLLIEARRGGKDELPCLEVRDWPDLKWRCLSPQLTWYAGFSRYEGFDIGNWSAAEWKWLADWTLLHKCNAWAVCMYGAWPFTLPGYEETTAQYDSLYYDPKTGKKVLRRYVHPNIRQEFFPEVIKYANARGIKVHAYIGKNSYNGTYIQKHCESNAQSPVAEALPFTPGLENYWRAFIKRILETGFNGFVFEDPEAYHVPNQNEECYRTFWAPWSREYGFSSVTETDRLKPPLGVHLEYSTWLFREFDKIIQSEAKPLQLKPEIYLIAHILQDRIMRETKSMEEQARWFDLIDKKHERKLPYIIFEANEKDYVQLLGGDRVATLGGRGGAASGFHRIASLNLDRSHGDIGIDLAEERDKQQRLCEAGGFGAMGYIFQWTYTEVFGYLAAQYQWRHTGVPGLNNKDAFGFLDYAYRRYYGDAVGKVVAQAYSENSCVNERMVALGEKPDYVSDLVIGNSLQREAQLLAAMADQADPLARTAYKLFSGNEPDLKTAIYTSDQFAWDGYDPAKDRLFKTERLRLLAVSTRRSQLLSDAAFRWRRANAMLVAGEGDLATIWADLSRALQAARESQLLYYCNYDDDYSIGNKGADVTQKLETLCNQVIEKSGLSRAQIEQTKSPPSEALRGLAAPPDLVRWEKMSDIVPPEPRSRAKEVYLVTNLGLSDPIDYFCLGTVFTIQICRNAHWQTIFRRALLKKDNGWQHWEIPLGPLEQILETPLQLRFVTDNYSRAFDRSWPSWKWGFWGQPQLVHYQGNSERKVLYDFYEQAGHSHSLIVLDKDRAERPFDQKSGDSTGATFKAVGEGGYAEANAPSPKQPAIAAFPPYKNGLFGITIAEFNLNLKS
jgi:hypothetical protein